MGYYSLRRQAMTLRLPHNARSALLVIDMQEFFFRQPQRRHGLRQVVANINRLINHFETQHMPVFHVVTAYETDGSDWELKMKASGKPELIVGTPETAMLPQIKVSDSHAVVRKTRYSAFFETGLAGRLRADGIKRVVVVGAYTHYCVNATVFDAYCHDFVPCIITDAVTSHLKEEAGLMVERMRRNGYHVFSTAEYLAEELGV